MCLRALSLRLSYANPQRDKSADMLKTRLNQKLERQR